MFTKKSSLKKLLSVALLSVSLWAFTGCLFINTTDKNDTDSTQQTGSSTETLSINGSWASSFDELYIIDTAAKTFDAGTYSYAGNEMVIDFTDKTSGYIYIKYTRAYEETEDDKSSDSSWTKSSYTSSYYRYSTTAPDVGKWYAIAFKDLTATSVSLSGAYGSVSSTVTLTEAKSTFTIENKYFGFYSDCIKQTN
ncbi:MAG: hypothetical protein SOT46_00530 [Treponema sp.]|nr:hypothetical protein [Spirochaetia bacterium]MDY2838843.1 hypothetical protein [Treponema sp.]